MKHNKGFTLIELLVVIAIIGILSSIILSSLSAARNKSKETATRNLIQTLGIACDQYKTDWGGVYPPSYETESPSENEGIEQLYHCLTTREGRSTRNYAQDISSDYFGDTDEDSLYEFVDIWGHPLVYVSAAFYSLKCSYTNADKASFDIQPQKDSVTSRWYRQGKFMIWSVGKYGKNENGLGDNLNNF